MFDDLREITNEIKRRQERIAELRSRLTSMSMPMGEKVQTTPQDQICRCICEIVSLEGELDGIIDNFVSVKEESKRKIFSLENEEWQDILYQHYIEYKPFNEIARNKGVSVGSVKLKSNRAMKKLKTLY